MTGYVILLMNGQNPAFTCGNPLIITICIIIRSTITSPTIHVAIAKSSVNINSICVQYVIKGFVLKTT